MGMVVRTNVMANNAFRQLGMNNKQVSKSLEKLASGFRINRAGDDAAGLAISERMKAQIKGLDAASSNSQDGISLVQTAEGALNEVHDMLNRMVELATKSANGVYTETQRGNYSDEMEQLKGEIDRIADSTNFNSLNLLDGSLAGPKSTDTVGFEATKATLELDFAGMTKATLNGKTIVVDGTTYTFANSAAGDNIDLSNANDADAIAAAVATKIGTKVTAAGATASNAGSVVKIEANDAGKAGNDIIKTKITDNSGSKSTITEGKDEIFAKSELDFKDKVGMDVIGGTFDINVAKVDYKFTFVEKASANGENEIVVSKDATDDEIAAAVKEAINKAALKDETGAAVTVEVADSKVTVTASAAKNDEEITVKTDFGGLKLQVGDTYDAYNILRVSVGDMHTKSLGVDAVDISSQASAGAAIDLINTAIDSVSSTRAGLGAIQNRLEHTINNLDTTSENLDAAHSRIRDTDMAKEMMAFTKMNVLTQSSQAMLAQANQQPQAVLQLLQ